MKSNWKFEKWKMGQYQENWKYRNLKKCGNRSMKILKKGKDDNRNKKESIIEGGGGGDVKPHKAME